VPTVIVETSVNNIKKWWVNKMSMKCTILCNEDEEDKYAYFHVWKHAGTGEYFMEIGDQTIRLSEEEVKTMIYGAKKGFYINESMFEV